MGGNAAAVSSHRQLRYDLALTDMSSHFPGLLEDFIFEMPGKARDSAAVSWTQETHWANVSAVLILAHTELANSVALLADTLVRWLPPRALVVSLVKLEGFRLLETLQLPRAWDLANDTLDAAARFYEVS